MEQAYSDKKLAIIVFEIKSSARELYPPTKIIQWHSCRWDPGN
jgi:hypothetical protein